VRIKFDTKIPSRWSFIILGVVGVALASVVSFFLVLATPGQVPYRGFALLTSPALPIRLEIPEIGVNSALEYVGLTAQGAVAVPAGPKNAAWFYLSPTPGNIGSAVIVGHDGWKDGIPAVFDNLYELKKGDKVYVEDDTGVTTTFVVTAIQSYNQYADATTVFTSSDGKAHLNLITCEGVWNPATQSYSNRIVVFTDKVSTT
jgi:LPXTG-site transpeptidase (sortase) family protein